MPSLEDVYCKFGFASEAAQLLELELGTLLFREAATDAGLPLKPDAKRAKEIIDAVDKRTLGNLLRSLNRSAEHLTELDDLLQRALRGRNRLAHSFYREHNFRRNSEEGRALMMQDLEAIHDVILEAYKALMRVSGVDLDKLTSDPLPTEHVRI